MYEKRRIRPLRALFFFLKRLFLLACVVIAAFAVAGYSFGWITFQKDQQKATIEIQTSEMKEAAGQAADTGKEIIQEAGEKIHKMTKDLGPDKDKQPKDDQPAGGATPLEPGASLSQPPGGDGP